MNNSWKKVIIVIASLVCVMIVCLAINVSVDKITGNILPLDKNETIQGGNIPQNPAVNPNVNNPQQPNGVDPQQPNGVDPQQNPVVNPNAPAQPGTQPNNPQTPSVQVENPLNYSKSQLIAYYKKALKKSYEQPKVNASKTEHVDVAVEGISVGSAGIDVDKFANTIIANNTKKNDIVQTKSFTNGRSGDGTVINDFMLPNNLYDGAVKSISASKSGNGYQIRIVLNAESCSHTGVAAYNKSCTWPLDINVIDFGAAVQINSCTFNYPGTVLTATIDSQGRVNNVFVEMPLTVANAQAKALGIGITVGAISGKWTCKNVMSF